MERRICCGRLSGECYWGPCIFAAKASFGVFVQVWLRWTLPRLRIDQVMTTCLKYLVPISCFLFLGAILWPLALVTTLGRTTWTPGPLGELVAEEVRENQVTRSVEASAAGGVAVLVPESVEKESVR